MNRKNNARRLWLLPVLLLGALAAGILLWFHASPAQTQPKLVEEDSWFSDFAVEGDRVYFLCRLTIRNPFDTPVVVEISGDFSADKEGGLILGRELLARRLDDGASTDFLALDEAEQEAVWQDPSRLAFLLQPGDNAFWLVFSALHGETSVKQDRLLPPITISPLADVTPEEVSAAMDCRIFKDPDSCDAFLVDGEELFALGFGLGGYGFTSAVPWDYDDNGVLDILFTYSWGSGMHRSCLALLDRTTREESEPLITAYRDDFGCSDLIVRQERDEIQVLAVDVEMDDSFADLHFTERAVVGTIVSEDGEPAFRYRTTLASPGEQIEGNEVYGVFERDGLYTVQLYDGAGNAVWSFGPDAREPQVVREEDDLWSVSVQAGTGIGTRWTVYYDAAADLLSDSRYAVFDRQDRLIVCAALDTLIIMDIFDGRILCRLENFAEPLAPTIDPFLSAAFTDDGKAVSVTYLAGEDYHEVTETVPLPEEFCP